MSVFENARWIFAADAPQEVVDCYFDYKQPFSVTAEGPVKLYISAHTQYAVYVNGSFVDCGQLPDTEGRHIYDTLDITPYVHTGENLLAITQYVVGARFSTCAVQIPGIIFAMYAGHAQLAASSPATLSGRNQKYLSKAEKMTSQMSFNFEFDANGPETVFAPSVAVEKPGSLIPRPTKKMVIGTPQKGRLGAQGIFLENDPSLAKSKRMQTAYLSSMTKAQLKPKGSTAFTVPEGRRADGIYLLYDMGGETVGFPQLRLEVEEETEVLVGFGEHLDDLRVRASCGYRHFCFRYVAKPGENLFFHPFRRIGLRYMQVHIYSKAAAVTEVSILPTRYPMQKKPAPVTDGLQRAIWDAAAKTMELCMQDHFCDCIWREQTMYPYDGRVEALYCYYAFEAPEFAREAIRICAETLRPDGLLEICAPGADGVCMPNYSAVYIRSVLEYIRYTGDESLGKEVFDVMHTIVKGFEERLSQNGLIALYTGKEYWHFYEWVPGMDGKSLTSRVRVSAEENTFEAPMNAFVADGFRCFAELCRLFRPELADHYQSLYEKMKPAIHSCFYREDLGGYLTRLDEDKPNHEFTQALMLHVGITPAHLRSRIEALIRTKQLYRTSFCYAAYTYEVLLDNPENRAFVVRDVEERWGKLIELGCDTVWETERGADDFGGAGALCQGASAAPLYVFGRLAAEQKN